MEAVKAFCYKLLHLLCFSIQEQLKHGYKVSNLFSHLKINMEEKVLDYLEIGNLL